MIIKYKPQGQTLGQLTREVQEEVKDKICYIGRLDPLASGLVCFLVGEECISSRSRLHSDKTYCFNLILGISTDSGDALGLIQKMSAVSLGAVGVADIVKKFNNCTYEQEYPMYSSYEIRAGGLKKPLWYFAKNGIPIDKIPTHSITIHQLEPNGEPTLITSASYFIQQVAQIIEEKSRLRKDEVIAQYRSLGPISLVSIPLIAKVSGGTYIRRFCQDIGAKYGIPAMADSIERVAYHFPS
jgi:tRNA pseudouridine(55) synthase